MKKAAAAILSFTFALCASGLSAQNYGNGLPATDALGRRLPDRETVGPPRKKFVGLFYWTWHDNFADLHPHTPASVIAEHPEAWS